MERGLLANQIGARSQRLAELDRGGPELLEGGGVVGLGRLAEPEAGKLDQAPRKRWGEGITLDPL
jgi:hypothetical protein